MKNVVRSPIIGEMYMATRHYNSKRIISEPFLLEGFNPRDPNRLLQFHYAGVWVLDNHRTSVSALYPFDEKWVSRKIKSLDEEIKILQSHCSNLQKINHATQSPTP